MVRLEDNIYFSRLRLKDSLKRSFFSLNECLKNIYVKSNPLCFAYYVFMFSNLTGSSP